ncbi:toll-like receptor Tollo [Clytia hemisphaerica]|uniref:EGF-like domain-containing protein n=1 Tax=Clytia hemisphaerica TaxID=252671 RepID=A0A7M5X5L3_9CNID
MITLSWKEFTILVLLSLGHFRTIFADTTCSMKTRCQITETSSGDKVNVDCSNKNINDSCLYRILSTYSNISQVEDLNLSKNRLSKFIINNNPIRTVLQSLLYLNLSKNSFTTTPSLLTEQMPQLLELDLSYNKLHNISSRDFLNTTGFRTGIPSLMILHLNHNRISTLHDQPFIQGFQNLQRLFLNNNLFDFSDSWQLEGLSKLIILDLSYNHIARLDTQTLTFSKQLSFLYLHHNQIQDLWSLTFVEFRQMSYLSLSHNNITRIHNYAISKSLIETLDLSHNRINIIPLESFMDTDIYKLYLGHNPLKCDCKLRKVLDITVNQYVEGTCTTDNLFNKLNNITDTLLEIKCDACQIIDCQIHEKCIIVQSDVFPKKPTPKCVCRYGKLPDGGCDPLPRCNLECQNNASCIVSTAATSKCVCTANFTGKLCESHFNGSLTTSSPTARNTQRPGVTPLRKHSPLSTGVIVVVSLVSVVIGLIFGVYLYRRITLGAKVPHKQYKPFFIRGDDLLKG